MAASNQNSGTRTVKAAITGDSLARPSQNPALALLSKEARSELNNLAKSLPSSVTMLQCAQRDLGLVVAITLAKSWIPDQSAKDVDIVVAIPDGRWSIDQLRVAVLGELRTLPISRRVVVIDRVDELEANASDTLLKAIEEPGESTVFILLADNLDVLNPTIRGRIVTTVTLLPATSEARESLLTEAGFNDELAHQAVEVAGEHVLLANVLVENPDLLTAAKSLRNTVQTSSLKPVTAAAEAVKEIEKLAETLGKHLGGQDRGTRAAKRELVEQHISLLRRAGLDALEDGVEPNRVGEFFVACDAAKERMLTHAPLSVNLSALHICYWTLKQI